MKKFLIDDDGCKGMPIGAFSDANNRKTLTEFCKDKKIGGRDVEKMYKKHAHVIESPYHQDGTKKKWYEFSLDIPLETFMGSRVEQVAYIILSHVFQRSHPGLSPHDGKDPRGISFSRFIIFGAEICMRRDFEIFELFMECLIAKPYVKPDYGINLGMMRQLFKVIHKNTDKDMEFLIENLPHNGNSISWKDLVRNAYKFPPLLFPVIEFQRVWRRKIFGENWWAPKLVDRFEDRGEFIFPQEKYLASERSERAVRTPAGATTQHIRNARFAIGKRRGAPLYTLFAQRSVIALVTNSLHQQQI